MASIFDDTKLFAPHVPSLLHITLVKVSLSLLKSFDGRLLEKVLKNIEEENTATSSESSPEIQDEKFNRAKESFLLIPVLLRERVLETVRSLENEVFMWTLEHSDIYRDLKDGKYILHWRSDGTLDKSKTAQQLVLNENIDITKRFKLACVYFLEKSVQILWSEMELSDKTKFYKRDDNFVVRFWVDKIVNGSQVHWTKDFPQSLFTHQSAPIWLVARYSSFFHLLKSEDRQRCLEFLGNAPNYELRFSLYEMTRAEEQQIVKMNVTNILRLYLDWPLQNVFLKTAEYIWNYIDFKIFHDILKVIMDRINYDKDFDYLEILEGFWNLSLDDMKEMLEEQEKGFYSKIYSRLNSIKKRKVVNIEQIALNKKVKVNSA